MTNRDDLRYADLSKLVHARFPDLPDVEPKQRTCYHGNPADGCVPCDRRRIRQRKGRGT